MRRRIKQPHEVRHLDGRAINWKRPPGPNKMCVWTKRTSGGKVIRGTFRHLCHLNRLNNLALAKYGTGIVIIQSAWNTTVAASAGTHDKDAVVDLYIPGVGWWEQQRFFRASRCRSRRVARGATTSPCRAPRWACSSPANSRTTTVKPSDSPVSTRRDQTTRGSPVARRTRSSTSNGMSSTALGSPHEYPRGGD
jgi:hypothetical protein